MIYNFFIFFSGIFSYFFKYSKHWSVNYSTENFSELNFNPPTRPVDKILLHSLSYEKFSIVASSIAIFQKSFLDLVYLEIALFKHCWGGHVRNTATIWMLLMKFYLINQLK